MGKVININNYKNAHTLIETDYHNCWVELKNMLADYLQEKSNNIEQPIEFKNSKYDRYCVAVSIEDLFGWMGSIEERNSRYLN